MTKHHYSLILFFLHLAIPCFSKNPMPNDSSGSEKESISIYFRFDKSNIEPQYRSNHEQITLLDSLLKTCNTGIDSIAIYSYASIEGDIAYNDRLSLNRSQTVANMIQSKYPHLTKKINININGNGEDWNGLLQQAYVRKWIPERMNLITLLENKSISREEKKKRLYEMNEGKTYQYLNHYVFWQSRNSASIFIWRKNPIKPEPVTIVPIRMQKKQIAQFPDLKKTYPDLIQKTKKTISTTGI
ncbi:MAG: OmpA family protein [Bacteroidales bacterium]